MSDLTKDIPKGTLTKEETIAYLIEIDNRFCIEPCVMRNAIYSACHYLDEESAKEPQSIESDLISRKKLLEVIENMTSLEVFDIKYLSKNMIKDYINNQPQVQPIVRSAEEIVEAIDVKSMFCEDCTIKKKCSKKSIDDCKNHWLDWLTGKEV